MKRECMGHTKMKRLQAALSIPQWQAAGLLESLWWLAARETPSGDIGKLADTDIALAIDYRGDAEHLMRCLKDAGWIEEDADFRYIIHDWWEHADDTTHARVARSRMVFVCGRVPKLTKLSKRERDSAEAYYSKNADGAPTVRRRNADGAPQERRRCADGAPIGDQPSLALPSLAKPSQADDDGAPVPYDKRDHHRHRRVSGMNGEQPERIDAIRQLLYDFSAEYGAPMIPDDGMVCSIEAELRGATIDEFRQHLLSLIAQRFKFKNWPYLRSAVASYFSSGGRARVITETSARTQ